VLPLPQLVVGEGWGGGSNVYTVYSCPPLEGLGWGL